MRILWVSISVLMIVLWGCSPHEDLEPPNNPFDPGNPDYVSPAAEIISGPGEGEVIDTTGVTFTWEGNETATEYSYQFDGSDWSEWTEGLFAEFDYLDEGDHSFSVQARSLNGDSQATPTALDFSVDAVSGPSALVYPYRQTGGPGDTLVYQIIGEEVTDLFAVECNITLNDEYLELVEVVIGDILNEWGGTPLLIPVVSAGSISISVVAVEGGNHSFTGTSSILTVLVRIKPLVIFNAPIIALSIPSITFLNPNQEAAEVNLRRSGELAIE